MGVFDRGVQMLLTTVGAFAAFSLMTIAVGTDYWLYSRGVCKVKSTNENETSKKNEEVMTHSGLWRTCCLEGSFKGMCKQIDHFPEDADYVADASEYFLPSPSRPAALVPAAGGRRRGGREGTEGRGSPRRSGPHVVLRRCPSLQYLPHHECDPALHGGALHRRQRVLQVAPQHHPQRRHPLRLCRPQQHHRDHRVHIGQRRGPFQERLQEEQLLLRLVLLLRRPVLHHGRDGGRAGRAHVHRPPPGAACRGAGRRLPPGRGHHAHPQLPLPLPPPLTLLVPLHRPLALPRGLAGGPEGLRGAALYRAVHVHASQGPDGHPDGHLRLHGEGPQLPAGPQLHPEGPERHRRQPPHHARMRLRAGPRALHSAFGGARGQGRGGVSVEKEEKEIRMH
ncbi:calcium channel, voltage-dependent, gamma subunit 2b isoform 2-T3 [Spinachia spinachia]